MCVCVGQVYDVVGVIGGNGGFKTQSFGVMVCGKVGSNQRMCEQSESEVGLKKVRVTKGYYKPIGEVKPY